MFVNLDHAVLRDLQAQGYNVLKSVSDWDCQSPTFRPAAIPNISEYLMNMQIRGDLTGHEHFLVISEALTIPEQQLFGVVWV